MQKIQSFDWLHFKFKFQIQIFKFSNSKQTLVLPVFVAKRIFKTHQHFFCFVFILVDAFSGSIKTEKTQKIFLSWQKIISAKENFRALAWRTFVCGNKTGSPGRAVSLHLARSGSQSEHRIRRILPARGACHVIIQYYSSKW